MSGIDQQTVATWLTGLVIISLFAGSLGTWAIWKFLHSYLARCIEKRDWDFDEESLETLPLYPVLVGILERLFFTILVAFNVSGVAACMGAWIVVKMAAGWSRVTGGGPPQRMLAFNGLISSLTSLLFATIGGLVVSGRLWF